MDILDSDIIQTIPARKTYFGIAALGFSIISILLSLLLFSYIPEYYSVTNPPLIPSWLPKAIDISTILGIISSTISFVRKEKATAVKYIGATLNIILLIILCGVIIIATQ